MSSVASIVLPAKWWYIHTGLHEIAYHKTVTLTSTTLYCGCFKLFCNMWLCVCVCVCVCGCVCVCVCVCMWVGFVMCRCVYVTVWGLIILPCNGTCWMLIIIKNTHTHTLQNHTNTHPHITKPIHTHPHITKLIHTPTHYKTHTYTHPHIRTPTYYKTI